MKKSFLILGLGFALLLGSCKKKTNPADFTATDLTGTATLRGNVMKTMATGGNSPAVGVNISVKVNNSDLYPHSPTASGSQVFTGTTDNNGNYSISVKTLGGTGVPALVTINQITGTFDPVTGTQAIFSGTVTTMQLISSVTTDFNFVMTGNVNGNTVTTGTATVMGTLKYQYFKEGPSNVYTLANFNLANHTVYLDFDRDPITQVVKTYTTTTDANGNYSFNITTTAAAGYNDAAKLYVDDYATTQDTLKLSGTTVTGKPGKFTNNNLNVPGAPIVPTNIKNGIILSYGAFVPN